MPVPVRRYLQSDRFTAVYCVVAVVWLTVLGFVLPEVVPGHDLQVISKLGGAGLVVGITVLLFSLQAGFAAEDRSAARGADAMAGSSELNGLGGITELGGDDGKHYTERMEALEADWPKVRPIIDLLVDEIYVVDPSDLRIIETSLGAMERSGFGAGVLLGRSVSDLFAGDDGVHVRDLIKLVVRGDTKRATADVNRHGAHDDSWVRVRIAVLPHEEPPILLLLVTDRSDIAAAERRVSSAEAKARLAESRRREAETGLEQLRDSLVRVTKDRDAASLASQSAIAARDQFRSRLQDVTHDRDRMAIAIEHAHDQISILDADGNLALVNRAWETATGHRRSQALGSGPDLRRSGLLADDQGNALWRALSRAEPWAGPLISRRADGTLLHTHAVLSPVVIAGSAPDHFVLTEQLTELSTGSRMEDVQRDRLAVARSLGRLRPGKTVIETAHAVCQEIVQLSDVAAAAFIELGPAGGGSLLGLEPSGLFGMASGYHIEAASLDDLRRSAMMGPFTMEIGEGPQNHVLGWALRGAGIRSFSAVPIMDGDVPVALLGIGTDIADGRATLDELIPTLLGYGAVATALVASQLTQRELEAADRRALKVVVDERRFTIVFQPVVDLATREVRGFEALTRFDDGASPRDRFETARRVGVGDELELATFALAVELGRDLPRDAFVSGNLSAAVLTGQVDGVRKLIRSLRHKAVLELSGPPTDDLMAVRRSVASLGPTVVMAVDDAGDTGIGYSELATLAPKLIKLGMSTTRGIETDSVKQALVTGMVSFAKSTGSELVAKGVETESELQALVELGIRLGQGRLFGMPAPVEAFAGIGPAGRGIVTLRRPIAQLVADDAGEESAA
jgi:PAS domain S-box-containing protein